MLRSMCTHAVNMEGECGWLRDQMLSRSSVSVSAASFTGSK